MSIWDQINLLTAGDAAKLAFPDNESEAKALFIKMMKSYSKALSEISTKHLETGHPELNQTNFKPKYQSIDAPLPEEHLYSRALEMQSKVLFRPNAIEASCIFFHDWYRDENGTDGAFSSNFDVQDFSREELHRWLTFHGIESAYQFIKFPPTSVEPVPPELLDTRVLATPAELIRAFGMWGLNKDWFDSPSNQSWLLAARKRIGVGGNQSKPPLYCPYEVMCGLATKTRPRNGAKRMSQKKGWRVLRNNFPEAYHKFQALEIADDQS
jgi:hypothetical protein